MLFTLHHNVTPKHHLACLFKMYCLNSALVTVSIPHPATVNAAFGSSSTHCSNDGRMIQIIRILLYSPNRPDGPVWVQFTEHSFCAFGLLCLTAISDLLHTSDVRDHMATAGHGDRDRICRPGRATPRPVIQPTTGVGIGTHLHVRSRQVDAGNF